MNPDGTDKTNLTPNSPASDIGPDWSPDGSQIAFYSNRDGNLEIYVMDADGSNVERLTFTPNLHEGVPVFSPDGSRILFEGRIFGPGGHAEIWEMDADGTDPRQLTHGEGFAIPGDFSPDGEKIVFSRNFFGPKTAFTMHADGSHERSNFSPNLRDGRW